MHGLEARAHDAASVCDMASVRLCWVVERKTIYQFASQVSIVQGSSGHLSLSVCSGVCTARRA